MRLMSNPGAQLETQSSPAITLRVRAVNALGKEIDFDEARSNEEARAKAEAMARRHPMASVRFQYVTTGNLLGKHVRWSHLVTQRLSDFARVQVLD